MQFCLWLLLLAFSCTCVEASAVRSSHRKRCRTADDLGRIPYFAPNSTFHNFGFPLIRNLCGATKLIGFPFEFLGCSNVSGIEYLYESVSDLRSGKRSSIIIVDPHVMEGMDVASSGSYVINAMFEILQELGYQSGVRHWSEGMNNMFPPRVAEAAMKISRQYDAFVSGTGTNPFGSTANVVMFQIEVPYVTKLDVLVNTSPYIRTFQWMIGLHQSHSHWFYQLSDPASHCTGANFFLGNGHGCSNSEVISCPQYDFHRSRSQLEVTPETRKDLKKNIILFDNDQNEMDPHRLKAEIMQYGGLNDLEMIVNQGRKRSEMPDLYKRIKMAIDCRNPGIEFINYEATLYDVMTLSCDMRATRNVFDFPVPSKYHINPHNWTHLGKLIHDSMINYEERIDDFKHFKRLSLHSNELAKIQVDMNFFSRDVMFRTHCSSYAECRRVYPWAVAVWTLYPMAKIEVVTGLDLNELNLDSDLIRLTLAGLFNAKYFVMYRTTPGVAPVDMFPLVPCAYMVYMDASFIPFGRDFLNTHVAALVKDPRPIVYFHGDKVAIAVMQARPYVRLFREGSTPYIELNFTMRAVPNSQVAQALPALFGEVVGVNGDYIAKLPKGAPFLQEHYDELVRTNPPLRNKPCEDPATTTSTASQGTSLRRRTTDAASVTNVAHRHNHTTRSAKIGANPNLPGASHARVHPHHLRHQQELLLHSAGRHHCVPHQHLILDAIYVPMQQTGGSDHSIEPTLWLTSSLPPLYLKTVFDTFSKGQIETIVQHMDPVLQNSNMRKILAYIPYDIADAFKMFDAIDYPNVISLRDMDYSRWGEKCA